MAFLKNPLVIAVVKSNLPPRLIYLSTNNLVMKIAVNNDVKIPMNNVVANPLIGPVPNTNKMTAKVTTVAQLGFGRPLGGRFDKDGTLYIADAHLGLTRLKHPIQENKVEIVASRVGEYSQILYANDLVIGPKTGKLSGFLYYSFLLTISITYNRINCHRVCVLYSFNRHRTDTCWDTYVQYDVRC